MVMGGLSGGTISPDGTRLVFLEKGESGKALLWIRPLDSFAARPLTIPEPEGALFPFWSPDSRSIRSGFATGKPEKSMPPEDRAVAVRCPQPSRGTWNRDGAIVFAPGGSIGLFRVPVSGEPACCPPRLSTSRAESSHRWPWFLPDEDAIFCPSGKRNLRIPLVSGGDVYVGSVDSGPVKRLVASDAGAVYAPTGTSAVHERRHAAPTTLRPSAFGTDG